MAQIRRRQNYLGVGGWVWAGKYKLERYLYILHRITGLGLVLYGLLHLTATTVFRIQGPEVWNGVIAILDSPQTAYGEYIVVVAFVFHTLNGFRLVLNKLGFGLGTPVPPIYPYKDSIRKKRPWTIILIIGIILVCVVFLYAFIMGGE